MSETTFPATLDDLTVAGRTLVQLRVRACYTDAHTLLTEEEAEAFARHIETTTVQALVVSPGMVSLGVDGFVPRRSEVMDLLCAWDGAPAWFLAFAAQARREGRAF